MKEGGNGDNWIDYHSILGRIIGEHRDKFIASFATEEMREAAANIFDEYMAAGCSLHTSDIAKMREIVEAVYGGKNSGELLVRKNIDDVRRKIMPLPRKGNASSGTEGEDAGSEEEQLLKKNSQALKAARLPSGIGFGGERPLQSGIKLLSSFRATWNKKKQA